MPNQSAAANRRPAGQSDGSGNLAAIVAADRAFPAAVAELVRPIRTCVPVNQFDRSNATFPAWVFWSIYLIELTGYHWLDNQCLPPAGQAGGR